MSLKNVTTDQIYRQIVTQVETSLGKSVSLLPTSLIRIFCKAIAGVYVVLYKYSGYVALQTFVRTADFNQTEFLGVKVSPLIEKGRLIGVGDPVAAVRSELTVSFDVNSQDGRIYPAGLQLVNNSTGVTYISTQSVALDAATKQITIKAISDSSGGDGSGVIGNLNDGAIIDFASPYIGIGRQATVLSTQKTGSEAETEQAYRQRVINRFQKKPQGGAYSDYEIWATEVASIIKVYPYRAVTPGQVDLYCESVGTDANPDGIPETSELQAVLDAVKKGDRAPVSTLVTALPITRAAFDFEILTLDVSDPVSIQSQIITALSDWLLSREPFVLGLTPPARKDQITLTEAYSVISEVVTASGGTFSGAIMRLNSNITGLHILQRGQKAKLGNVNF